MAADDLQLQVGARLLHIGPHKTGTTMIEDALHPARERLAARGVAYPGTGRRPGSAGRLGPTPVSRARTPGTLI
jgi:hypothetical protein